MKSILRLAITTVLLTAGAAVPALAQIDSGVDFTTSFPFYAQNAKLPAGSYKITQPDMNANELLIESPDGKYSVFIDFIPTHAEQPHNQSDVTFHKYGDVDYLNRIWVEGQRYGVKLEATKTEEKAATANAPTEHSVICQKHSGS